jgi:hypothetical protein
MSQFNYNPSSPEHVLPSEQHTEMHSHCFTPRTRYKIISCYLIHLAKFTMKADPMYFKGYVQYRNIGTHPIPRQLRCDITARKSKTRVCKQRTTFRVQC